MVSDGVLVTSIACCPKKISFFKIGNFGDMNYFSERIPIRMIEVDLVTKVYFVMDLPR